MSVLPFLTLSFVDFSFLIVIGGVSGNPIHHVARLDTTDPTHNPSDPAKEFPDCLDAITTFDNATIACGGPNVQLIDKDCFCSKNTEHDFELGVKCLRDKYNILGNPIQRQEVQAKANGIFYIGLPFSKFAHPS